MAPNGKYYKSNSKIGSYSYSEGNIHQSQQKKEGVWSFKNNEGYWMWHNGEQKFVLNTSDSDGGKNSFPSIGNVGTTYAGGNNPKNNTYRSR